MAPELDQHYPDSRLVEGYWARTALGEGQVLPDGHIDVMCVSGETPFLAGPDTKPANASLHAGAQVIGLRLRVGVAATAFADSAVSFADQRIALHDLTPAGSHGRLDDELGNASHPTQIADALIGYLDRLVPRDWHCDHIVDSTVRELRRGATPTAAPLSERQHRRRFRAAMGYGPKTFERICRLERFIQAAHADSRRRPIAHMAAECGYFDQAHLARDAALLANKTPLELTER